MRNTILSIGLSVCLVSVIGCNNNPECAEDFEYSITMGDTLDVPSWSDMIDSVSYITLKTDDNIVMGEVEQIVVKDDLMYVLANGVFCFDMNGYCQFNISNRGRARNEFIEATSLSVSEGKLNLYDRMKQKVLVFDAYTGRYVEDVDTPPGGIKVYCIGESLVFEDLPADVKNYTRFKVLTDNKYIQNDKCYFSEQEHKMSIRGTCSWSNDGLIYSSYLRNTAWKIDNERCVPYVRIIVPEKNKLSDKDINNMISNNSLSATGYSTHNSIYGLSYLTECDGFITGQLNDGHGFIYFLHDKETGNSKFFNSYSDPEVWHYFPAGEGCAGDADCMYMVVSPETLILVKSILGSLGNEPTEERFQKAYEVVNTIKKDDNPIIARFWLNRI